MIKHLSTLSILHYVYGIFVCLIGLAIVFFLGIGVFLSGEWVFEENGEVPQEQVVNFLKAFGGVLFLVVELWGLLIILSGYYLSRRSNRTYSIVVAALCLLSFPIGTALGVFTLVVLSNDEVEVAYRPVGSAPWEPQRNY